MKRNKKQIFRIPSWNKQSLNNKDQDIEELKNHKIYIIMCITSGNSRSNSTNSCCKQHGRRKSKWEREGIYRKLQKILDSLKKLCGINKRN